MEVVSHLFSSDHTSKHKYILNIYFAAAAAEFY